MARHVVRISPAGQIRFIHNDVLRPLFGLGVAQLRRASHVEPGDPAKGQDPLRWYADLAPVNGPVLGGFTLREEALHAEADWLHEQKIPVPAGDP